MPIGLIPDAYLTYSNAAAPATDLPVEANVEAAEENEYFLETDADVVGEANAFFNVRTYDDDDTGYRWWRS